MNSKSDGKTLETIVATIEALHLPRGFEVKTNRKEFNSNGVQTAEFDVEIIGKIGTSVFRWLFECRDRPSDGAAPGSWIEQLYGRRNIHHYDKVTAVSTTGFAPGAIEIAKHHDIELREVSATNVESFSTWLTANCTTLTENQFRPIKSPFLNLSKDVSIEVKEELKNRLKGQSISEKNLRIKGFDGLVSVEEVIYRTMYGPDGDKPFQNIQENGIWSQAVVRVPFPLENQRCDVCTESISGRVDELIFWVDLRKLRIQIPIAWASAYSGANGLISQSAGFEFHAWGKKLLLEMHNLAETGHTHVLLRFQK